MGDDSKNKNGDCNQPCADLQRLKEKFNGYGERLSKVEYATDKNEENISSLQMAQAEIKTYIEGFGTKLDNLENRLFTYLEGISQNNRQDNQDWREFSLKVIKWTVAALIGYLVAKGGI